MHYQSNNYESDLCPPIFIGELCYCLRITLLFNLLYNYVNI